MRERLVVLTDREHRPGLIAELESALGGVFQFSIRSVRPDQTAGRHVLVDINLASSPEIAALQATVSRGRPDRLVILVDAGSRAQTIQARSLGAAEVLHRPATTGAINLALGLIGGTPARVPMRSTSSNPILASIENGRIAAAVLNAAFGGLMRGAAFDQTGFEEISAILTDDVDAIGVDVWLQEVRRHHAGTYQHCLTVAGLGVAFARSLGLGSTATCRVALAGLVHDIGKAKISPQILDKPGKLTDAEMGVMRQHPGRGFEYLKAHSTLDDQILTAVLRHHEYLDGTGYPGGFSGGQIDDLTRIITICDIHAALIELRGYKLPMRSDAAYAIVTRMSDEGKLDAILTARFGALALGISATLPHPTASRRRP